MEVMPRLLLQFIAVCLDWSLSLYDTAF